MISDEQDYEKIINASNNHMHLSIVNKDDREIYVVFGALDSFNKIYFLQKSMLNLNKNVLFVNSERNDWYVEPQSFLSKSSVEDSARCLQNIINGIIRDNNFISVTFVGHSMGAYGVLLYTQFMEFSVSTKIIVSNPKIDLTLSKISIISENYPNINQSLYKDLYNIALNLSLLQLSNREYIFLYGEQDLFDIHSALYFKKIFFHFRRVSFRFISFKDSGHYLFRVLQEVGLDNSLEYIFTDKFERLVTTGNLDKYLELEDIQKLIDLECDSKLDGDFAKIIVDILTYKYPTFFYGLNHLGYLYMKQRRYREAISYLQVAFKVSPSNLRNNMQLSQCYEKLGYLQSAIVHYSLCLKFVKSSQEKIKYLDHIIFLSQELDSQLK